MISLGSRTAVSLWRSTAMCAIAGILACGLEPSAAIGAEQKHVTIAIEAEAFSYHGDWQVVSGPNEHSGGGFLFAGSQGAPLPAATAIELPRTGRYWLWVRALDFPSYQPGIRTSTVSVHGKRSAEVFGDSGTEGWAWEPGGSFELPAGRILVGIHDVSQCYGRVDALVLTTDERFRPQGKLGTGVLRPVAPAELKPVGGPGDLLTPRDLVLTDEQPQAVLENEFVRYTFLPAASGKQATVAPRVELRKGDGWRPVELDATAEIYAVLRADGVELRYDGTFPIWKRSKARPVEVGAGGNTLTTARSRWSREIWQAGELFRFEPISAELVDDAVRIDFAPSRVGRLVAEWRLAPGHRAASLTLLFTPAADGVYSLGYHLFFRRPMAEVEELQLPFAFQRRRFPDAACMVLDPHTPTPLSLAQTGKASGAMSWAVIGSPEEIPFAWPDRRKPHMGFGIRDEAGSVQPAVYGPIPGTERARLTAQQTLPFRCNVLVQRDEWYGAYRTAADEVFGFRDYRRNGRVSLSDAVLNMIDLVKDDEFGGWWRRAKGWYQIESRNTVTHAAPATMLSLYRLTGDRELYRRRALPTMEYVLSRNSVHFTPEPKDPGRYSTGPMSGPVSHYGTSTFSALWRLTDGHTPAFKAIALPADQKVRRTVGYSHAAPFNEWAARYRITGDKADLQQVMQLADEYLAQEVLVAPTRPIGHRPFWLISFVPDWEGLLMMYELTRESRYLEGAVIGARQLMAGLWTQPVVPPDTTTVFPGGTYAGDPWSGHLLARGPYKTRLGFPLRSDSLTEHQTPAWAVSCVGLGFEQPCTLGAGRNRLIYQAVWAPEFLRLARYTGDKAFETCARNATVGRWANYPGYYVAGHNDLVQEPAYPLVGPDQSVIYYHHIVPHLSWTIDYLVSDAELLSDGNITFPWLRENGYAFFDGRVFGHAPGKIFDEAGCWLWFQRGAVVVSNPQINVLTAHNDTKFFAVLTNQDTKPQPAGIYLSQQALGICPETVTSVTIRSVDGARQVELSEGMIELEFGPRQLLVVEVAGTDIAVGSHRPSAAPTTRSGPTELETEAGGVKAKAAAIAVAPEAWDAFVWCIATEDQVQRVTLETKSGESWNAQTDTDYPFEFSLPMRASQHLLLFRLHWESPSGERFSTEELSLNSPVPSQPTD